MHELSIAQSLVEIAARQAESHGSRRVVSLDLILGSLAGVQADALSFCFPIAARETPCEGAELRISFIRAIGTCPDCGASAEVSSLMEPCGRCESWPLRVEGGTEMTLRSVEVS